MLLVERFKELYKIPDKISPPPSPVPSPVASPEPITTHSPEPLSGEQDQPTLPDITNGVEDAQSSKQIKFKSSSLVEFINCETDVIKRVKRETAREARERRAKRRAAEDFLNAETALAKNDRQRKRSKVPPKELPSQPLESQETETLPSIDVNPNQDNQATVVTSGSGEEPLSGEEGEQLSDNETSSGRSGQSQSSEQRSASSDQLSVSSRQTDNPDNKFEEKQSEASSIADSEDEVIDIGSPPSPPSAPLPTAEPHIHRPEPTELRSPLVMEGYTSSPKKGFSICSETVIEQFEQHDNSYEQRQTNSSNQGNAGMYERYNPDADMPYHYAHSHPQYSQQYESENRSQSADTETRESSPLISHNTDAAASTELGSTDTYASELPSGRTSESVRTTESDSTYDHSTDEEEEEEEEVQQGGVPVSWEDHTENVPSEAPSDELEAESGLSADESDLYDDHEERDDMTVLPIRINKRKVCLAKLLVDI